MLLRARGGVRNSHTEVTHPIGTGFDAEKHLTFLFSTLNAFFTSLSREKLCSVIFRGTVCL